LSIQILIEQKPIQLTDIGHKIVIQEKKTLLMKPIIQDIVEQQKGLLG
jgi:hypothetical protein